MELGRSGRPTMMLMAAAPYRREVRGHRTTPAKFCSSDIGCSASLAQRGSRNDRGSLAPFTLLVVRTRARDAWLAAGEVDVAAVADFFLRGLVGDGARAVGATDDDADGGGAVRREVRGHRTTPAKFCSSDIGCSASLAQRAARNDRQNLAPFTLLVVRTRARDAGRQLVRSTSRPSPISFYAVRWATRSRRSGRPTMMMSASPGGGGGVRAQRGYGVIEQRRPNSAALTLGAWPRSFYDVWSGCSGWLERSAEFGRVNHTCCFTRARRAAGRCRRIFSFDRASRLGGSW